jgi:hypothetical protein
MSITPYNNLSVIDLNGNQQSYVNSTTEVGYFSGEYSGTIPKGTIFSLPAFLKTNNRVATVDPSGSFGLKLNAGIYKINLSLFPTSTQDGSSNISFNFGTRQILYDPSTNLVSAFGGVRPTGMITYDPSNNPYSPGIISWVADGYSSGNSISDFQQIPYTYELAYKYNNAGYPDKKLYSGISTTEMTFVLDSSANIFFNAYNNSNADITMGNCCFTLKLISSSFTVPVRNWRWTVRDASNGLPANQQWRSIASSSTGQYLAACINGGYIWMSSDYGATWSTKANASGSRGWVYISSSLDGSLLLACVFGGFVYISRNYGANWSPISGSLPTGLPSTSWTGTYVNGNGPFLTASVNALAQTYVSSDYGINWRILANIPALGSGYSSISNNGKYLLAGRDSGTGGYSSIDYGQTWSQNLFGSINWRNFSVSLDGRIVVGVGNSIIYTSSNYGVTMTVAKSSLNGNVSGSASSSNGQYLAVSSNLIYTSSDYGTNWFTQTNALNGLPASAAWSGIASSSDGFRLAACINPGVIWIGVYS